MLDPVADPVVRTHAAVRARYVQGGASFAVVIDSLPAGRYTIWQDPVTALAEVDIPSGGVAEYTWPAEVAAA